MTNGIAEAQVCRNCEAMEREKNHALGELGRVRFRADNDIAAIREQLAGLQSVLKKAGVLISEYAKSCEGMDTIQRCMRVLDLIEDATRDEQVPT